MFPQAGKLLAWNAGVNRLNKSFTNDPILEETQILLLLARSNFSLEKYFSSSTMALILAS